MLVNVKLRPKSEAAATAAARRRKHSKITLGYAAEDMEVDESKGGGQKMYVFYGSNTGTSESFAQRVASDAKAHG